MCFFFYLFAFVPIFAHCECILKAHLYQSEEKATSLPICCIVSNPCVYTTATAAVTKIKGKFAFAFAWREWILNVRGCTHHDHGLVVVVVSEHGEGGGAEHGEPLLAPGVHPLPAVCLRAVHDHQQVEPPNLNTGSDTVNVGGRSGRWVEAHLWAVHNHQQVEPPNLNTGCDVINVGEGSGQWVEVRLRAVHNQYQVEPPNLNTGCDTVNVGGGPGWRGLGVGLLVLTLWLNCSMCVCSLG